uniref:Uncharacterized protein n=1 Tax=Eiseniibacteriota bacterium TaxID=2212470 RepID=A0A832MJI6_UNCEI
MASAAEALSAADRALLERLAARIVALRLEVPALLALESSKPLALVAGQGMVFFEPLVQALFHVPEYERWAALVQRREALEALAALVEEGAARRGARRP